MRWGRRGLRSHGGQPASLEGHTAQCQQGGGREGVAAGRLSSDPGSARKEPGHLEHAVSLPWPPLLYPSSGSARPVLTQRCVLIVHGSGSDLPSDIPVSKCSDKSLTVSDPCWSRGCRAEAPTDHLPAYAMQASPVRAPPTTDAAERSAFSSCGREPSSLWTECQQ